MTAEECINELSAHVNPAKARILQRFFKTGKGDYAEGDVFLGVTVPEQRKIAKKYRDLSYRDVARLLKSPIHEHRLTALLILILQFECSDENSKKEIVTIYLEHLHFVNNWDLVDLSAPKLLGAFLCMNGKKGVLLKLVHSKNMWERRVAILATLAFIRQGSCDMTIELARILLGDKHDLIHKATGWMLREAGKKDKEKLVRFLQEHKNEMPRTMLRYAIEKFDVATRKRYLETVEK